MVKGKKSSMPLTRQLQRLGRKPKSRLGAVSERERKVIKSGVLSGSAARKGKIQPRKKGLLKEISNILRGIK